MSPHLDHHAIRSDIVRQVAKLMAARAAAERGFVDVRVTSVVSR